MYVTLVFIVKIIFLILIVSKGYVKHKNPNNKKLIQNLGFWKDRVEFIFKALMSALLIFLFNPRFDNLRYINYETKLLLSLFGFILLISADWKSFVEESKLLLNMK